mgnify:CR=1 FL=1
MNISKRRLMAFSWVSILLAYMPYMQMHFSSDSYANIGMIDTNIHLVNGRFITYLVQALVNVLHIDVVRHQTLITLFFITILAIDLFLIIREIFKYIDEQSYVKCLTVGIGSLFIFVNVFFAEWFLYVESLTSTACGITILTISIIMIARGEKTRYIFFSFALLVLCLNMYQLYVEFYVAISLVIIYVRYAGKLTKRSFGHLLLTLAVAGSASAITILIQLMIKISNNIPGSGRDATLKPHIIINNIKTILYSQKTIWGNGSGLLPTGLLVVTGFFLVVAIAINKLYIEKDVNSFLYAFIILCCITGMTYAPHIISETVWMAPRTIVGIFHLFFAAFLIVASNQYRSKLDYAVVTVAVILLVINMFGIHGILCNNIANNHLDENSAWQIEAYIEEYEHATGNYVTKIATVKDASPTYFYKGIKYVSHDMNIRGLVVDWADVNLINFYCDKDYQKCDMPEAICEMYFKDKNWDVMNLQQQAVFKDDTLYLAMY